MDVPNRRDVTEARLRLHGVVRRTPVLTVTGDEFGLEPTTRVHLKLEHLQQSGTFKARGAANALRLLEDPTAGVVAASGGNHGVAVAWAAQRLGVAATIFVPEIASAAKTDRLRRYGANVQTFGEVFADSLAAALDHAEETGAELIHAYDDARVMAGAATVAAELDEQLADASALVDSHESAPLDRVLVACGGGGLSGGMAVWWQSDGPMLTLVETEQTGCLAAAVDAGEPVDVTPAGLCADALGATRIGDRPWAALSAATFETALVGDDEVREARAWLWDRFRLLVEPAAATTIAHLRRGAGSNTDPGRRIGVVLCGANTPLAEL